MPRFDATGPAGAGPFTGRGMGYCAEDSARPMGMGRRYSGRRGAGRLAGGRGMRRSAGGFGRCFYAFFDGDNQAPWAGISKENLGALKERLTQKLSWIEEQLQDNEE